MIKLWRWVADAQQGFFASQVAAIDQSRFFYSRNKDSKQDIEEGFYITAAELEQREREAFEAALETLPSIATDKGMRSKYEDAITAKMERLKSRLETKN